jgi:hypothetical protein
MNIGRHDCNRERKKGFDGETYVEMHDVTWVHKILR